MRKYTCILAILFITYSMCSFANYDKTINGIKYNLNNNDFIATVNDIDSAYYSNRSLSIPSNVLDSGNMYVVKDIDIFSWQDIYLSSIFIPHSVTSITIIGLDFDSIIVDNNNPIYDSRDNCNAIIETKTNTLIYGCKNTIIPYTVEKISDYAFVGTRIEKIIIPQNVKIIGKCAFEYCWELQRVCIPFGVVCIESYAFFNCRKLESIILPNTIKQIGDAAFSYCENLTEVYLPNSIEYIGKSAFQNCKSLKSIYIPSSVKEVHSEAFSHCDSLRLSIVPYVKDGYENNIFDGCFGLKKLVMIVPRYIEQLTTMKIDWWDTMTDVVIEKGVTEIEDYTFKNHPSLERIIIPNSVWKFGLGALYSDNIYYDRKGNKFNIITSIQVEKMRTAFWESSYWGNKFYSRYIKISFESHKKQIITIADSNLKYHQPFSSYSSPLVTQRLIDWVEQKEGERQAEWIKRTTNDSIQYMKNKIYKLVEQEYIHYHFPSYKPAITNDGYYPEGKFFLFYDNKLGYAKIYVPNEEAEYVDMNWKKSDITYTMTIKDDIIVFDKLIITLPNGRIYSSK